MLEAVKVALDPTPVQERLMLSHAGGGQVRVQCGARPRQGDHRNRREAGMDIVCAAPLVEREQGHAGRGCGRDAVVAGEQQGSLQQWSGGIVRRPVELVEKPQGRTEGPQGRVPEIQGEGSGDAAVRVHDRQLRPRQGRSEGAQTAAHRPRALHGERRRTRGRGQGAAHDGVVPCGTRRTYRAIRFHLRIFVLNDPNGATVFT